MRVHNMDIGGLSMDIHINGKPGSWGANFIL